MFSLILELLIPLLIVGSVLSEIFKVVKKKKAASQPGDDKVIDLNMTRGPEEKAVRLWQNWCIAGCCAGCTAQFNIHT